MVDVTIGGPPNDAGGDMVMVTLSATDGNSGSAMHTLVINVLDSVAPVVSFNTLNATPNHVVNEGDTDTIDVAESTDRRLHE